jgi:hypothetical protein
VILADLELGRHRGSLVLGVVGHHASNATDPAGADPTPEPSPGYQIPGPDGPTFPGTQVYPPVCLTAPLACGLRYHAPPGPASTGTVVRPAPGIPTRPYQSRCNTIYFSTLT